MLLQELHLSEVRDIVASYLQSLTTRTEAA